MGSRAEYIIVGCDLHEENLLLKIAADREEPEQCSYRNRRKSRKRMIEELKKRSSAAGGATVVFAYEASSMGYLLHDELEAAGITCHVLAPSKIDRSPKGRATKTDETDAQKIFELLRGHLLAGNKLPSIWVPDDETRDAREITRARQDAQATLTRTKTKVTMLLKRYGCEKPPAVESSWTAAFRAWIKENVMSELAPGAVRHVESLLHQVEFYEEEVAKLTTMVEELAQQPRHQAAAAAMDAVPGVGILTAMTLLAELGDLQRFSNGKQVASYLGLVPSCHESGEASDRKGHITRQGPARARWILNQAAWSFVRCCPEAAGKYRRIAARNPGKKKKALVAVMADLAIRLWHRGLEASSVQAVPTGASP